MAKAEEKVQAGTEAPSMEEILQSIRGVIAGDETTPSGAAAADDVLELTELAEEPKEPANQSSPTGEDGVTKETSILDDIDAALGDEKTETAETAQDVVASTAAEVIETEAEQKTAPAKDGPTIDDIMAEAESDNTSGISENTVDTDYGDLSDDDDIDLQEGNKPKKSSKKNIGETLLGDRASKLSSSELRKLVNTIPEKHVDSPVSRGGTSLEDLVIEAMKPFLAEWLNKNLPLIVKKIVEKEVRRLIPKDDD